MFGYRSLGKLPTLIREGSAHLVSEDYEPARSSFLKALEFRDAIAGSELLDWLLMALESTWTLQDAYDEEIAFFSEYIRRYPDDAAGYCARACGFWYSGKLQEAVSDYARVLELKPDTILALSARAQVLVEMGQNEKALEELEVALRTINAQETSDPQLIEWNKHIEAFVQRGRGAALAALGDTAAAMEAFGVSMTLSPDNAWVFYSRAEVYEKNGNYTEALSDYQISLEKKGPPLNLLRREQALARLPNLFTRVQTPYP